MNASRYYWVEFIGDRSIKVEEGQTILSASLAAGIPHYHACGGNAKCSTSRILLIESIEHITPQTEAEKALQKIIFKEVYDQLPDPAITEMQHLDLKGIKYHLSVYAIGHPFQ